MLFRSTLLLSLLGASMPETAPVSLVAPRKLQTTTTVDNGKWEVADEALFYYNVGEGNGAVTTITEPTILIAFEHDDVTAVSASPAYGTIDVTHYEGGCTTVIEPGLGQSEIGGAATQAPLPFASGIVTPENSGLSEDYTQKLTGGVLTVIRYKLGLLDDDTRVTQLLGGEYVTKFCTRLSLLDFDGTELGYHELDVTVKHSVDSVVDVTLTTDEDTTTPIDQDFGDYSVRAAFATPGSNPTTDLTTPANGIPVTTTGPILNQGEEFTLALIPQRLADGGTAGTDEADATEMDIISVDECFFWIDSNGDGFWIQGELRQYVVLDKQAVSPVTKDLVCSSSIIPGDDIDGCAFTVTLPTSFYADADPNDVTVKGICTVTLEFDGDLRVRRQLQLSAGDQGQVSTLTELSLVRAEAAGGQDGNCWDGCFFLFCWINIIICWFQSLF